MLGQPRRKRTHPGQALKKPEAQPLPGCEDTVITTSGLAKASHFIPRRILSHVERRRGEDPTTVPRQPREQALLSARPVPAVPSPTSPRHRAMLCAFVIPHPTVPAKSLSCHNRAWSCRIQNNSGETSPGRGRGPEGRAFSRCKGAPAASRSC